MFFLWLIEAVYALVVGFMVLVFTGIAEAARALVGLVRRDDAK